MKRLAVIDLMFRWPPDGGARVDVKETVSRLAQLYDVVLFVPQVDCVIKRGEVTEPLPFRVEVVPFQISEFSGPTIIAKFSEALDHFKPDIVFLADGFYLKPWVAMAAGKYPYFVKFYAYENLCLRGNGTFMRGDRSCYRSGLSQPWFDQLYCTICGCWDQLRLFSAGYKKLKPEFIGSRAYSVRHWTRVSKMLDGASSIVVYNHLLQGFLQDRGWQSIVIPGGINVSKFPAHKPRSPDGVVRMGVVGRIDDANKGIGHAIRALNVLHQRGIKAELHLTGDFESARLKIHGVVFRGWFSQDTISEFYKSVDICLIPSIWQEPFGIVALESMCSGRPIVASRVAGLQESITDHETGLLVAPQSAEAIADAVMDYVQDPELMHRIVKNAEAHVRKNYDWNTVVDKYYVPLIENILVIDGIHR